jgi:hypothetical protein
MKSKFKNVNEQIERIKSLFTEDRLYGNLINEQCSSAEEAIDYLEAKDYIVQEPGSSATKAVKRELYGCLTDDSSGTQVDTDLGRVYKEVKSLASNIKIEIREEGGTCILLFSLRTPCDLNMQDSMVASIYVDESVYKLQVLYRIWKFDPRINASMGVQWVGYEGEINISTSPMKYQNLEYKGLYTKNGTYINGTQTLEDKYLQSYNFANPCKVTGTEPPGGFWPTLKNLLFEQTDMIPGTGTLIDLLGKITCISGMGGRWKWVTSTPCV